MNHIGSQPSSPRGASQAQAADAAPSGASLPAPISPILRDNLHVPRTTAPSQEALQFRKFAFEKLANAVRRRFVPPEPEPYPVATLQVTGVENGAFSYAFESKDRLMDVVDDKTVIDLVEGSLKDSGQMDFLLKNSARLVDAHWGIRLTVKYIDRRDPKEQAFFHQDTYGHSLFSTLIYDSEHQIVSPEYILNPVEVEETLKMLESEMPFWLVEEMRQASRELRIGQKIDGGYVPPYGTFGLLNLLCIHSTPFPGSRSVALEELKKKLDEYPYCYLPSKEAADSAIAKAEKSEVKKLYMPDLLDAGVSREEANVLLRACGANPLDTLLRVEGEIPLDGHRNCVLPRKMSEGALQADAGLDRRTFLVVVVDIYDKEKALHPL